MSKKVKIAIIGGGEKQLSVLSQFHELSEFNILGVYDTNKKALALEIAEIIGIDTYSDSSFADKFTDADYIVADKNNTGFREEIELLTAQGAQVIDLLDAHNIKENNTITGSSEPHSSYSRFESALKQLSRLSDRDKLLEWILGIAVERLDASSGSIMLYSENTEELYIGYAKGLSSEVIENTRQKLGEGIAGKAASLRKVILTTDIAKGVRGVLAKRERNKIQTAVTAPIIYRGNLIGVLNISTDRDERELTESDRDTAEIISKEIAPVLYKHMEIDTVKYNKTEKEIQNFIGHLIRKECEFHEKFSLLSKFISKRFDAATVAIYTATDEGDWLILGGSDNQIQQEGYSSRIHCSSGSLGKAYLNSKEVIITEDAGLSNTEDRRNREKVSFLYLPLVNNDTVGVLVIEFSKLDPFEQFMKHKENLCFQLGFFINSQLKDLRHKRNMERLEKLSDLTPELIVSGNIEDSIDKLSSFLSKLVSASMGSLHYFKKGKEKSAFFNFPSDEQYFRRLKNYDSEITRRTIERSTPECTSYLTTEINTLESPPFYYSTISYPVISNDKEKLIYIGYNKETISPLDSSIFGKGDIKLLSRGGEILKSIYSFTTKGKGIIEERAKPESLEELLKFNQSLFISKVTGEIERAERYHQTFTVTVFKITGLKELLRKEQSRGLIHINHMSSKLKKIIRKTDFFSWIEPDIFAILSLESYGRITKLERRIRSCIDDYLKEKDLFDPELFHSKSSFARFPGKSETAPVLIMEAKNGLE
ncbi:MAG TPA: GAF domain-containing protein [Candidatus Krumholzibacteriaceae bacterium]|nr:GAF domain-containing protein [Candidatus Krumholzibacteriaceae bacterium]